MKNGDIDIEAKTVGNIQKIINEKQWSQYRLYQETGISDRTISKIFSGQQRLRLEHISIIARALHLREIDLLTYPDIYVKADSAEASPAEVLLQLKLTQEKKDQVLKLVFGENNIEILNK